MEHLKFVADIYKAETEEKGSKFISFLIPFDKFENQLKYLKNEHPKAVHFVYAYRFLNEFRQIVENSSDDGEPKGTSGKPCLKVLEGNNIINSAVIVVRYFGGTKLGTGGLVRAYSDSVNKVLENAKFEQFEFLQTLILEINYNELSKLEYKLKLLDIKIISKNFDEKVIMKIEASEEKLKKLMCE